MAPVPRLVPVPPDNVTEAWPHVTQFVADAAKATGSIQSVAEWQTRCRDGLAQLWLIAEADDIVGCLVTEIYNTERGTTCALPITTGALEHVPLVLDTIRAWAKQQNCVRLEGVGRPGWVKALKPYGWRPIAIVIEADI